MAQAATMPFHEPVAAKLAIFLQAQHHEVLSLVDRAEHWAQQLRSQVVDFVICHADMHAGNILIGVDGAFYLVDWDTLILAPKERDLMFVGGGQFINKRSPEQEERLFYAGYGQTAAIRLAYYERIVQDMAEYCQQLLATSAGGADREAGYRQLTRQFLPNGVIEMAKRTQQFLSHPPPIGEG